jgi:hypothetical protein
MATLEQIDPANFNIPNPDRDGANFTYYTLVGSSRGSYPSFWDIVGVFHQADRSFISLRFLHLEEDVLEAADFDAFTYAQSYLGCDPEDLLAFIAFLKGIIVEMPVLSIDTSVQSFISLSTTELHRFHFKPYWQKRVIGYCYRYQPSEEVLHSEKVTLLMLPYWSAEHGRNQQAVLKLLSFREEQLSNPTFDPLNQFGVESITLDPVAFNAFINLLEQHTYKKFGEKRNG